MTRPMVYIVDDDEGVRESLTLVLRSAGISARSFASAHDFLQQAELQQPGCVLLDLRMPGMSGLELQQTLTERESPLPIIIISGHGNVPVAVQTMRSGAMDFFEKPFDLDRLIERIRECLAQETERTRHDSRHQEVTHLIGTLTPREREIFDMLVQGAMNKTIAARLGISIRTVEVHRANLMSKLEASNVSDLVHLAMEATRATP
jgi:two-component system, LuxR family, response regulator FixJ